MYRTVMIAIAATAALAATPATVRSQDGEAGLAEKGQASEVFGTAVDISGRKESFVKAIAREGGLEAGYGLASGMDNSTMFDDVPFNRRKHTLELQDVGLTSLYVMDCQTLAEIARILGRRSEAEELERRGRRYSRNLATLWNEDTGLFLDHRTDTCQPSRPLSPTHFYPLICRTATAAQAERMIAEHFYNPDEFWGHWIMPSSTRGDLGYADQRYWRGRIWAPMNFLVYLGLRNYDLPQAKCDLAEKSKALLLKKWLERGHVHENYNADTGEGCDKSDSERLYHWGGLLGIPAMIEAGHLGPPEEPLLAGAPDDRRRWRPVAQRHKKATKKVDLSCSQWTSFAAY